ARGARPAPKPRHLGALQRGTSLVLGAAPMQRSEHDLGENGPGSVHEHVGRRTASQREHDPIASDPASTTGGGANQPRSRWFASTVLIFTVLGVGGALAAWKRTALQEAEVLAASQPEPMEAVTVAVARERMHTRTTTAIGTVLALRSITLRNELPGTVREVRLVPGPIVGEGTLLVALDVSVEEAELRAQQAQAALAETVLRRLERAGEHRGASAMEIDRARAELDVARAQVERIQAVIARKTIRAPFRARVGMADIHPGQYLDAGTYLTTLQGVDEAAHVDFTVAQRVAAALRPGDRVELVAAGEPVHASI